MNGRLSRPAHHTRCTREEDCVVSIRRPAGGGRDESREGLEPSRSPAHRARPGRRQHRRLRVRRSERPGHGDADCQLHPVPVARRRPELLPVRSQRPLRDPRRQQRRRRRGRDVPVALHDRAPQPADVPLQHRPGHDDRRSRPQRAAVLQPHARRRAAADGLGAAAVGPPAGAAAEHRAALDAELRPPRRRCPAGAAGRHARVRRPARRGLLRRSRHLRSPRRRHRPGRGQHRRLQRQHPGDPGADGAADAQRVEAERPGRSQRRDRRVGDGEPPGGGDARAGADHLQRRLRPGVAPRHAARQRSGDRSGA